MAKTLRVGMVGYGFMGKAHSNAWRQAGYFFPLKAHVELHTICGRNAAKVQAARAQLGWQNAATDWREIVESPLIDIIDICTWNDSHAEIAIASARAGKHVVCEKPLAMTLEEAERMVDACRRRGVLLMYAEELLFTPKYVKAKEMAGQGAFGRVYLVKQSEKHFGPHSAWFWDVNQSGGGVFMDMGCHGVCFCWWFLGRPAIRSVYCQMGTHVHADKTEGEDDSLCILEFAGGAVGLVENSWARRGGMDDRIEVFGEGGCTYANLHMGNALPTYSEYGYGYAVEKAPATVGWSYPVFDELWNYGFPQEMRHFARCVRGKETPVCTGEDGLAVMEVLYAGYASAGAGRKIELPFRPRGVAKPIDLWRGVVAK